MENIQDYTPMITNVEQDEDSYVESLLARNESLNTQVNSLKSFAATLETQLKEANFRMEVMRDKWVQEMNRSVELEIEIKRINS